ncbi:hypothetical protein BHZ80_27885 [Salmonella enterica]|nr:hypothetical protein [Salmonella enterica]EAA9598996.1 hypothetical protein [Salmonella enterica]EAO9641696.1 hypothetical protein [Salmonella enterica]
MRWLFFNRQWPYTDFRTVTALLCGENAGETFPPLLPLMFLFALLSGCAPAVLITSASVATRTATDPRSTGRQIDDGTLTLRVSHAISSAGLPLQARVTATVYQGNVLLTGEVPDDAAR